jgi:hypothetical protein
MLGKWVCEHSQANDVGCHLVPVELLFSPGCCCLWEWKARPLDHFFAVGWGVMRHIVLKLSFAVGWGPGDGRPKFLYAV